MCFSVKIKEISMIIRKLDKPMHLVEIVLIIEPNEYSTRTSFNLNNYSHGTSITNGY